MSGEQRQAGEMDVLELAEAVAGGRLTRTQAEAALRDRHAGDAGALAADQAELDSLIAAIGGVQRHAVAFREAADRRSTSETAPTTGGVSVDPRRVGGSGVVLRSRPGQRNRWAAPALLAAAAVVVVAVVIGSNLATAPVAASPSPASSAIAVATPSATVPVMGPSASPSASSTVAPTATPVPTAEPTGAPNMPAFPSAPLDGAPRIALWTLRTETSMTITDWAPDGSPVGFSFQVSTWADPDRHGGTVIDRRVVAAPDGSRIVVAETEVSPEARARVRVFGTDGSMIWTDPSPTGFPDLVWSGDGSTLVVGSQPATWKIVSFGSGAPKLTTRTFAGQAYRVLGFSLSGDILYGWDTQGEAEWWQTPFQVPTRGGTVTPITRFSGKAEPITQSNGTTPTTEVTPADPSAGVQPGVDPITYRVLDRGGAAGNGDWEIRDGAQATPLLFKGSARPPLAWGPRGDVVAMFGASASNPGSIGAVSTDDTSVPTGPACVIPPNLARQAFFGLRGSTALMGFGENPNDATWMGVSELVAVDVNSAKSAVFVLGSTGLTGIHVAGFTAG